MAISESYKEFVRDLLSGFGPVTIKPMFSGVYVNGTIFAIVVDDTLYLKADETSSHAFAAEGKGPFTYTLRGKAPVAMPYWEVPERLLDDPEELANWAREAYRIACTGKPKAPRKRR
jgi:DNA transformation protein